MKLPKFRNGSKRIRTRVLPIESLTRPTCAVCVKPMSNMGREQEPRTREQDRIEKIRNEHIQHNGLITWDNKEIIVSQLRPRHDAAKSISYKSVEREHIWRESERTVEKVVDRWCDRDTNKTQTHTRSGQLSCFSCISPRRFNATAEG